MSRHKHNTPSTRQQAARLLDAVLREQRTLDEAVVAQPPQGEASDTRFTMLLVLVVLRHLGQIDALLTRYVSKPLPDKRVIAKQALRLGVAQLLLLDTPPHAAVNETVQLVKDSKDTGLSGLVNAVLQKIVREKPILPSPIENVPAWLRTRWERHYDVAALAAVAAERPPLDMVAAEPQTFAQGERIDAHVWRLPPSHESVTELEGFGEGAFWVQDVAATYPVRALGDVKGLSILDIGAAPGGKTAQLAKAGAQVTALDKSAARMDVLKENMARLKLTVEPVVVDALRWEPGKQFDAVLLDAPCSATGTWRRHPEVLHITTQHDITELSRTQREMLTRAWQWVKPGGRLVYCTCSLEPEEGEQQAQWFVANHSDAAIAPVSAVPHGITTEGYVRTTPALLAQQGGMDGFFAAIFKKQ